MIWIDVVAHFMSGVFPFPFNQDRKFYQFPENCKKYSLPNYHVEVADDEKYWYHKYESHLLRLFI